MSSDLNSPSDMVILTRTFDFLKWLLPQVERFPKLYRSSVTQRLKAAALDFQEALFLAQSFDGQIRLRHLRQADAHLSMVRLYLRLALAWGWLNRGQYAHVSRLVAELGKLLGGWTRATQTEIAQEKARESAKKRRS